MDLLGTFLWAWGLQAEGRGCPDPHLTDKEAEPQRGCPVTKVTLLREGGRRD